VSVRRRPGRSLGTLATAIAVALAATACESAVATLPPPTPTPEPLPTGIATHYPLATTAWVQGLVLTFHDATAVLDPKGGPVSVLVRAANPGAESAALDAPIQLVAGGKAFDLAHGTELPDIDAGATVELTLGFEVDGLSSIDDGILRVGRTGDHQAIVPLRAANAAPVTLQPRTTNIAATATAHGVRLALHRIVLRWDLPDWYQQLGANDAAVTLTYDVTYVGSFPGGFAFTRDNVALRLPDGRVHGPRRDGRSQSLVVIGEGKTAKNLFSRFDIPAGLAGTYSLLVRDGSTEKRISFNLKP
jgi:hypothetical protein